MGGGMPFYSLWQPDANVVNGIGKPVIRGVNAINDLYFILY